MRGERGNDGGRTRLGRAAATLAAVTEVRSEARDSTESDAAAQRAEEFAALPAWLQRLATESWQVELLISGFAIVGSTQLVGLLEPLAEWVVLHVRFELIDYVKWAIYYLGIGFAILPVAFVVHFALRTYWVGLVSLSSVYPHGFGTNFSSVPEFVVRDTQRRSPGLVAQIDAVERRSSIMFAIAALSAMVFASIAITLGLIIALGLLLEAATGGRIGLAGVFGIVVGALTISWLATVSMLALKRYHDRPGFQRAYLRANDMLRKGLYTVFEQPANYLSTLLTTNASKASVLPLVAGMAVMFAGILYIMTRPSSRLLIDPSRIAESALMEEVRRPSRYRSEWTEGEFVVDPAIERELVPLSEPLLRASLPMLGEDDYWLDELNPEAEGLDGLPDASYRARRFAAKLAAARRYWRVSLDGREAVPATFAAGSPAGQDASGFFAYVDVSSLPPGPHLLEVATLRDTGYAPRAVIPFRLLDR